MPPAASVALTIVKFRKFCKSAWLRDKHILIVLDNCEHVIGAAAAMAEAILKAAPRAGILATSREPLRTEGEWLHRLAALELPPQARTSLSVAEALGYSAVELLTNGPPRQPTASCWTMPLCRRC